MQIHAAVAMKPGADFEFMSVELDDPRDDEILVRVVAAGLCHTDIAYRDLETGLALPAVFGHEGAGIVERVGNAVTKVVPGDRVLMSFRSCGACPRCSDHDPSYCHQLAVMNFTGRRVDGSTAIRSSDGAEISSNFFGQSSFASHALTYERNVVKLPDGKPLASFAPLGCGVQTGAGAVMRSLACRAGSTLAVLGVGTVGLSAVMGGVVQGCSTIIAIDPMPERRKLAIDMGATHAIDPFAGNIVDAVRSIVPIGVDYLVDCSGVVSAVEAALGYLAPKGVIGLIGIPSKIDAAISLPIGLMLTYGFTVKGIIEGDSEPDTFLPELIQLHEEGRFPFDRLITTYPFAELNQAIADQHSGKAVKVVLRLLDE
jgi:aryl-alcohol dehydrogenase